MRIVQKFIVTCPTCPVCSIRLTMEYMFSCLRMINLYYLLIHLEIVSPTHGPMRCSRLDFGSPPTVEIVTKSPCVWRWPLTSDELRKDRDRIDCDFFSLFKLFTYIEKHCIVDWEEVICCYVFGLFHVLQFQIEQIKLRMERFYLNTSAPLRHQT